MNGPDSIPDVAAILDRLGFDADRSVLTRRQAEVLALRERGLSQAIIADRLGTSRANISGIEASGRENVEKARETVAFAEALASPVTVEVEPGIDLYDVPRRVFSAADDADLKVNYTAPELMTEISDTADDAVRGREVHEPVVIGVSVDGEVSVRRRQEEANER